MRVLFVQFEPDDGPGRLGMGLDSVGVDYGTARLYAGAPLPALDSLDGLVLMGGTMNAEDDARHPYLPAVAALIREAHQRSLPTLGICLGSQIMARAFGAAVRRKGIFEIGYFPIDLTEAGRADPLFRDLPAQPITFQWHEDAFELPAGATLLADSQRDSLQAFRRGTCYGLQFHPEVAPDVLARWSTGADVSLAAAASPTTRDTLLARSRMIDEAFAAQTVQLCRNFATIMQEARAHRESATPVHG